MAAQTIKITKAVVAKATATDKRGEVVAKDAVVRGLELWCYPPRAGSGAPRTVWKLYYRTDSGQRRRPTLGDATAVHPAAARSMAREMLGDVARGSDPSAERRQRREAPTVADLLDGWLEQARTYKKASSLANDELYIRKYIKPALGREKVASLTRAQVADLHRKVGRDAPVMANRVLAVVSAALAYAEQEGIRPQGSNVCKLIRRFPEQERHRALSEIELHRLAKTLREWPHEPRMATKCPRGKRKGEPVWVEPTAKVTARRQTVCDVLRLILLTGMRRSEAAHLKWSEVDAERMVLRLEDSKSGPRLVYLNTAAIEVIERQERQPMNPFVFASPSKDGSPLSDLKRSWRAIREAAGLDTLRVHDLRHHAGEALAAAGHNEAFIAKLLGHKDLSVTRRYVDVAANPLHRAAEGYGEGLAGALGLGGSADDDTGTGAH